MIKKSIKKFIKGYLVLVTIILLLTSTVFIFQSCTNDNYYEVDSSKDRTAEVNSFKNAMKLAGTEIKKNSLTSRQVSSRDELALEFVQKIEHEALILIRSYGITDQQIIDEFGSLNPEKIALTAQLIVAEEELIDQGKTLSIFVQEDYQLASLSFLGVNSTFAQSDTVGGCFADAVGITAAFQLIEGGIAGLGQKGVLKLIKKIGGKYLGAVGAILAAYDFADCMGWLTQTGGPLPDEVSSCNDLLLVNRKGSSFAATYYISKKSINYKSADEFEIVRHQLYRTYNIDYGFITADIDQINECKVSSNSTMVNGMDLDISTLREIN